MNSIPPSSPDHDYQAAADEFVRDDELVTDEDEDDEGDGEGGEKGSKGKAGGRGAKKRNMADYEVVLDRALLDFSAEEGLEPLAALLDIVRKLKLAAPSDIIRGVSTFGPEHPEITVRELGILTQRIGPKHAADPNLLKKLDAAQRELRQREGIPHPDDHMNGGEGRGSLVGSIAGLVLGSSVSDGEKSPQDKAKERRAEGKLDKDDEDMDGLGAEPEYEYEVDPRTLDLMSPPPEADFNDVYDLFDDDLQFDAPDHTFENKSSNAMEMRDAGERLSGQVSFETAFDTLAELFNVIVKMSDAPVEHVVLRQDLHIGPTAIEPQRFEI